MVPWGTPETTGNHEEAELLTTTGRFHPVRKLWSQDVGHIANSVVVSLN